jgi:hypothetical protein
VRHGETSWEVSRRHETRWGNNNKMRHWLSACHMELIRTPPSTYLLRVLLQVHTYSKYYIFTPSTYTVLCTPYVLQVPTYSWLVLRVQTQVHTYSKYILCTLSSTHIYVLGVVHTYNPSTYSHHPSQSPLLAESWHLKACFGPIISLFELDDCYICCLRVALSSHPKSWNTRLLVQLLLLIGGMDQNTHLTISPRWL